MIRVVVRPGQLIRVASAIACQCFLQVMGPCPAAGQGHSHKFPAAKSS